MTKALTKLELTQIIARQNEELALLRAQLSVQNAPRVEPNATQYRELLARAKALGAKHNCLSRVRDGAVQLYSKQRTEWCDVPADAQA